MTLQQLAVAKDRKDKLLSRLHKKRLELDFRDRTSQSENNIHCCKYCANLFPEKVTLWTFFHARETVGGVGTEIGLPENS